MEDESKAVLGKRGRQVNGIQPGDIVEWTSKRKRGQLLHATGKAREEGGRVEKTPVERRGKAAYSPSL